MTEKANAKIRYYPRGHVEAKVACKAIPGMFHKTKADEGRCSKAEGEQARQDGASTEPQEAAQEDGASTEPQEEAQK